MGIFAAGGVAVASELAVGGVAVGNVAIGQVVEGTHSLCTDIVTKEEIKRTVMEQYPDMSKIILKLILAGAGK